MELTYVQDGCLYVRSSEDSFARFSLKDAELLLMELPGRIAQIRRFKEQAARKKLEEAQAELNELEGKRQ